MSGCDFCGKPFEGLPHRCKYCGESHCSDHILPESHECRGLNKPTSFQVKSSKSYNSHNHKSYSHSKPAKYESHSSYDGYKEMYHPSKSGFNFRFANPFRNLFSFRVSHDIKDALTQFAIALFIGLVLNYVYYQNFSLNYLFIGGVQEWFNILISTLNYGLSGGYDILYLVINGFFYYYLFSTVVKLFYAVITNLNRKGTWWFLAGAVVLVFAIFKYFPNLIY